MMMDNIIALTPTIVEIIREPLGVATNDGISIVLHHTGHLNSDVDHHIDWSPPFIDYYLKIWIGLLINVVQSL
jgi:hypothetical protein